MAESSDSYDMDELVEAFKCFCAKPTVMTTKDCGRLVNKCWGKSMSIAGDIAYSKLKAKGQTTVPLNRDNIQQYLQLMGKEWKKGGESAEVELAKKVITGATKPKPEVKTSKTGAVDRLTDTSKYTGSHKERFDETGKGKGAAGRQDKVENKGYVHNYKNAGTYDQKK